MSDGLKGQWWIYREDGEPIFGESQFISGGTSRDVPNWDFAVADAGCDTDGEPIRYRAEWVVLTDTRARLISPGQR